MTTSVWELKLSAKVRILDDAGLAEFNVAIPLSSLEVPKEWLERLSDIAQQANQLTLPTPEDPLT